MLSEVTDTVGHPSFAIARASTGFERPVHHPGGPRPRRLGRDGPTGPHRHAFIGTNARGCLVLVRKSWRGRRQASRKVALGGRRREGLSRRSCTQAPNGDKPLGHGSFLPRRTQLHAFVPTKLHAFVPMKACRRRPADPSRPNLRGRQPPGWCTGPSKPVGALKIAHDGAVKARTRQKRRSDGALRVKRQGSLILQRHQ